MCKHENNADSKDQQNRHKQSPTNEENFKTQTHGNEVKSANNTGASINKQYKRKG